MTTDEMRELDAWIAENVFGMDIRTLERRYFGKKKWDSTIIGKTGHFILPYYTTEPAAAFEVLKKCQLKAGVLIRQFGDNYSVCATNNDGETLHSCFTSTTLELAICMFAKQLFTK